MISIWSRLCVKSSTRNSLKRFALISNRQTRNGSYSIAHKCFNSKQLNRLPYRILCNLRLQHNETQCNKFDDEQNLHSILKSTGNYGDDFSVDQIMSTISEMDSMLKEISIEYYHKKNIRYSKEFIKLFSEIQKSFEEISVKDLIRILSVFAFLDLEISRKFSWSIQQKVQKNIEDMDLADKIYLLKLMVILKKEDDSSSLKYLLNEAMKEDLRKKSSLDSPSNVIAMLDRVSFRNRVHPVEAVNTLKLVLGLKHWDDKLIYKEYLNVLRHVPVEQSNHLQFKDRFLGRLEKECFKHNNIYFMCCFLMGYAKAVTENVIDYDKNIVDHYVGKILKGDLKTRAIKYLCIVLSDIRHTHYDFTNYLVDLIEKYPYILSSHPYLGTKIIATIARSNCNHEETNRYGRVRNILQDSPHLADMLRRCRDRLKQHIHLMLDLSSLGVFSNDEIKYLSDYINRDNLDKHPTVLLRLLVYLNHAVKVLHPSCPHQILNDYMLSLILKKFNQTQPSGNYLLEVKELERISKCLMAASNVYNCILIKCLSKSGFTIDGILGVTEEGNFYNFRDYIKKNKIVYMEDIRLPEEYNIVALSLIFEKEHSRNEFNLNALRALAVKVAEKVGYRPVIVYQTIWDSVERKEKQGNLHAKICDAVTK